MASRLHKQESNSQQERTCNCRIREQSSLDRKCLKSAVTYQAAVTANDNMHQETYIGLTETRYYNHKVTFRNDAKKSSTELSNYTWSLVNNGRSHSIKWMIVRELYLSAIDFIVPFSNLFVSEPLNGFI